MSQRQMHKKEEKKSYTSRILKEKSGSFKTTPISPAWSYVHTKRHLRQIAAGRFSKNMFINVMRVGGATVTVLASWLHGNFDVYLIHDAWKTWITLRNPAFLSWTLEFSLLRFLNTPLVVVVGKRITKNSAYLCLKNPQTLLLSLRCTPGQKVLKNCDRY